MTCVGLHATPISVKRFGAKGDAQTDDTKAIQQAIKAAGNGGTVAFPAGTYRISSALNLSKPIRLQGTDSPVLTTSNANYVLEISANNIIITGLIFNGGGIHGTAAKQTGFTIVNDRFQNIMSGSDAVHFDGILTDSSIDSNTFFHIAPREFLSANYESLGFPGCWSTGPNCDTPGAGIVIWGGLDQTSIINNLFDLIASDAMHIGWNSIGASSHYFLTRNNVIAYNQMSRVHRIGLEIQAIWNWPHCGVNQSEQCDLSHEYSTNTQIKGNYFHDPFLAYTETYAYSFALWGDGQYINNSAVDNIPGNCIGHLGYGMEIMGNNVLTQGNIIASEYLPACDPHGWHPITYGGSRSGTTFTTQNNVVCGDQATTNTFTLEPNSNGTVMNQYNIVHNSCSNSGSLNKSNIAIRFTSTNNRRVALGGNEAWTISVVSNLSIKHVEFFVDGGASPFVTRELQDVNTNFAVDRQWLYHGTFNTSNLSGDHHTITVRATDVSGAMQSASQNFLVDARTLPSR